MNELEEQNIAEAVARTFATFCSIDVIDDAGTVRRIAVAHPRPEQRSFLRRYTDQGRFTAQHPVLLAIRSGISTCVPDATRWETDPPQSPSQIAALERLRLENNAADYQAALGAVLGPARGPRG